MPVFEYIIRLIYPPRCYICLDIIPLTARLNICAGCYDEYNNLAPISGDTCAICGKPAGGRGVCGGCAGRTSYVKSNRALFLYEGAAREIIYNLKYRLGPNMRSFIKDILAGHIDKTEDPFAGADYIIPVPLHKSRLRERGYNQALILAQIISELTGIPVLDNVLIRTKKTAPQSKLNPRARKTNTENAFNVYLNKNLIFSKAILLIDDIYTTGSTLEECAKALLSAGADSVKGFTFCVASGKSRDDFTDNI